MVIICLFCFSFLLLFSKSSLVGNNVVVFSILGMRFAAHDHNNVYWDHYVNVAAKVCNNLGALVLFGRTIRVIKWIIKCFPFRLPRKEVEKDWKLKQKRRQEKLKNSKKNERRIKWQKKNLRGKGWKDIRKRSEFWEFSKREGGEGQTSLVRLVQ